MSPRIRFEPDGIEVEVPIGTTILAAGGTCGAHIGSACGGVCACSTCHVYVKECLDDLSEMEMGEEDRLDNAFDVRANSRLGCQTHLQAERLYVVEISRESRTAFFDEHPELREKK
jgi:ferredoxin, 2Fe-2S